MTPTKATQDLYAALRAAGISGTAKSRLTPSGAVVSDVTLVDPKKDGGPAVLAIYRYTKAAKVARTGGNIIDVEW